MAERPISIRIPEQVRVAIAEIAGRSRRGFSSIANEMLEEAIRMRRIPGVDFADEFEHREAKVAGTGLGVWEVIAAYQRMGEDWERFKKHYENWLNEFQLRAALAYWHAYPEEIDGLIAESYSWTPEKLYSTYPFMKPPEPGSAAKRIAERQAETLRFYFDENIPEAVTQAARRSGIDVLSAHELGRYRLTDADQLLWAAEQGRCVVTRDVGDFPGLSRRFAASHWPHAGVALVPRSMPDSDIGGIVRALVSLAQMYEERLPSYSVVYLAPVRPRR